MKRTVLSLCDQSGEWPRPYREAGYNVIQVDLKLGVDVIELAKHPEDLPPIYGILAAPPCTHFTVSGAQYWPEKDADGRTEELLKVVDACLEIIDYCKPAWWALENPVGRLPKLRPVRLGKYQFIFDPCDYGDPYTKKTCLWGDFNLPMPIFMGADWSVEPIRYNKQGSWIQSLGGASERTKELRSITPSGFARAFFVMNP